MAQRGPQPHPSARTLPNLRASSLSRAAKTEPLCSEGERRALYTGGDLRKDPGDWEKQLVPEFMTRKVKPGTLPGLL